MENAVFNDQFANELLKTGDSNMQWVGIALVIIQVVIIPVTLFLWRNLKAKAEKEHKDISDARQKIADLETEKRRMARDKEHNDIRDEYRTGIKDNSDRISALERDTKSMINNVIESQNRLSQTLDRLFTRMDDMVKKVDEISIFMHVQKSKETA